MTSKVFTKKLLSQRPAKLLLVISLTLFSFPGLSDSKTPTPSLQMNVSHSMPIVAIRYAHNGKIFATGSQDFSVKVWRSADHKLLHTLKGHASLIKNLRFDPNDKHLLSISQDMSIRLWRLSDSKLLWEFKDPGINDALFDSDGNILVSTQKCVELRSFTGGSLIKCLPSPKEHTLKFSNQFLDIHYATNTLVVMNDRSLLLYNLTNHTIIHEQHFEKEKNLLTKIALSPDGETLITLKTGEIKLWDLRKSISSGKPAVLLHTFKNPYYYTFCIHPAPNKKKLAIFRAGTMELYDYSEDSKPTPLFTLKDYRSAVSASAFHPFENVIVLAALNISFWDTKNKSFQKNTIYQHTGGLNPISYFWPDGKKFITSNYAGINIRDLNSKNRLQNLSFGFVRDIAVQPFGRYLAIINATDELYIWGVKQNSLSTLTAYPDPGCERITNVTFSRQNLLAAHCQKKKSSSVLLWKKLPRNKFRSEWGYLGSLKLLEKRARSTIAFSHDGEHLIAMSSEKAVIWKSGATLEEFERSEIKNNDFDEDMAVSPAGNLLIWFDNYKIFAGRLSEDGTRLVEIFNSPVKAKKGLYTAAFAFHPDGKSFAMGANDGVIRFWNTKGEQLPDELTAHSGAIHSIDYHKNGEILLNSSGDGAFRFWDLKEKKELITLISETGDEALFFTRDGRFDYQKSESLSFISYRLKDKLVDLADIHDHFYTPGLFERALSGVLEHFDQEYLAQSIQNMPTVRILNRGDLQKVIAAKKKSIPVVFSATQTGAGLSRIEIRTSGILVKTITPEADDEEEEYIVMVPLTGGENKIEVSAYGKYGAPGKEVAYVRKLIPPGEARKKPNFFGIVVAIEQYEDNTTPLTYSIDDAAAIKKAFQQKGEGLYSHIDIRELYNENARAGEIKSAINYIKDNAQPGDVVVFYFSGHGYTILDQKSGNKMYFYRPFDLPNAQTESFGVVRRVAITAEYLNSAFAEIKARKVLLVLDTCHSGAALTAMDRSATTSDQIQLQKFANASGRFIFTSAAGSEVARESEELKHGLFTWVFINALQGYADYGNAAGMINDDDYISLKEIQLYLDSYFMEQTSDYRGDFRQNPVINSLGRDPGGNASIDFDLFHK